MKRYPLFSDVAIYVACDGNEAPCTECLTQTLKDLKWRSELCAPSASGVWLRYDGFSVQGTTVSCEHSDPQ